MQTPNYDVQMMYWRPSSNDHQQWRINS